MAGDITIKIGGKSTTQPAVDRSIGDLKRLQGGVAQVGKTLGGLKAGLAGFATLWGLRRISSGLHNVLGNLDEIGDRLGGTLGAQAHQASDAFGDLRDELRGITDEIAGRMSPAMTVFARDLKEAVAGTGARDGLGDWFEEKTNQASVLIEKMQELHQQSALAGIGIKDALKFDPIFGAFESIMALGGSGKTGSRKVEALKSENAEEARIKAKNDAELAAQGKGFAERQAREAVESAAAAQQRKAQADWDKFSAPAVGKAAAGKSPNWGALGGRGMDAARKEFDRAQKDAQAAKQDDADRLRAMLAPAPGLAPREANRLTRGLGMNVDPADQLVYLAKEAAKREEEMVKADKAAQKALEKIAAQRGRGVF